MKRTILTVIYVTVFASVLARLLFGHIVIYKNSFWEITRSEVNLGVKNLSIFGNSCSVSRNFIFENIEEGVPWRIGCELDKIIYNIGDKFTLEIQDSRSFKTYEIALPTTSSDSWGPVGVGRFIIQLKNDENWIIIRNGRDIIMKVYFTRRVEKQRYFSRLEKIMSI